MQHRITEPSELLNREGHLHQMGWMTKPLLKYNPENIGKSWMRIKEWDYYAVIGLKFGITFTIAELGFLSLFSIVCLDFENKTFTSGDEFKLLTRGKTDLPQSSETGDIYIKTKNIEISVLRKDNQRILRFEMPKFDKKRGISGKLVLHQPKEMDTMTIATPWKEDPKAFYYNQKINCMPTEGTVVLGSEEYTFVPEETFSVLDWGRGVWTYRNTWYWGSASGVVDSIPIGFNIGYGFGDTSAASENMIFYDNTAHKLEQVEFIIDEKDYLKPWKFTSNDGRFEMDFKPILDRNSTVNLLIFKSVQHQVFGYFSGTLVLDNGDKIQIKNLLGFAEKVYNRW